MKCVITGVETENKYRNIPVSTEAVYAAKKFMALEPGITLKEALMKLDEKFTEMIKQKIATHNAIVAQDSNV